MQGSLANARPGRHYSACSSSWRPASRARLRLVALRYPGAPKNPKKVDARCALILRWQYHGSSWEVASPASPLPPGERTDTWTHFCHKRKFNFGGRTSFDFIVKPLSDFLFSQARFTSALPGSLQLTPASSGPPLTRESSDVPNYNGVSDHRRAAAGDPALRSGLCAAARCVPGY